MHLIPNKRLGADRFKAALIALLVYSVVGSSFGQLCPPNILSQQERQELVSGYFNVFSASSQGGYILGGTSYSPAGGEKISPNYGLADFYLVGLHPTLEKGWDQSYGGTNSEAMYALQELTDGYILGGESWSGASGNKSSTNYGRDDFWIVRTDLSGNLLWDKSFGGSDFELLLDLQKTADGGFILAGISSSGIDGNKSTPNYGGVDYWIVRTDASGNKLWDQTFGGTGYDRLSSIQECSDGGFILGGSSDSTVSGTKMDPSFGEQDYWVIRVDASGQEIWQRTYGGIGFDQLIKVRQGTNGGFILFGSSTSGSSGNRESPQYGYPDIWVVAIDANGDKVWEQSVGGGNGSEPKNILPMADGGWLVGATSYGPGGNKTGPSFGQTDYWLVRFDASGNILWNYGYGGRSYDYLYNMDRNSEGVVLIGQSQSRSGGNKTTQLIGPTDLWVVQLGLETPGDCDGDGILDGQDLCPNTQPGAVVSSNGCSIAQFCPCSGSWTNHAEYVQCVNQVAANFVQAGLITEAERTNAIAQAEAANCPFVPTPILAFGLTNFALGAATVTFDEEVGGGLFVTELGPQGSDGVSMQLGEADSGLFIYPHAPVQDWYNESWFMDAKAYGSINGVTNVLLSTMEATKPNYETYPVRVEFEAVPAESVTYQVFSNKVLVREVTEPGAIANLTIHSATYLSPRGNPLWRAPDGSIGAVIDLVVPSYVYGFSIDGPFYPVEGDHIFIRANPGNSTNVIDFVSRVHMVEGGGLASFSVLNARLGMFHRGHQALGSGIFTATSGKLKIQSATNEDFAGTLIEADGPRLDVQLEPLTLETNGVFELSASAVTDQDLNIFGSVGMTNVDGTLKLKASFELPHGTGTNTEPSPIILLKVYNNGVLAGSMTNADGAFTLSGPVPAILSCGGAEATTNSAPHLAITLDQHRDFTDGTSVLRGNQFRILPLIEADSDVYGLPAKLSVLNLGVRNFPSFTIVAEQSEIIGPPLSIAVNGQNVTLSWPSQNQPFVLESTASLDDDFVPVSNNVLFIDGRNTVTLPLETTGFFRLRLSEE